MSKSKRFWLDQRHNYYQTSSCVGLTFIGHSSDNVIELLLTIIEFMVTSITLYMSKFSVSYVLVDLYHYLIYIPQYFLFLPNLYSHRNKTKTNRGDDLDWKIFYHQDSLTKTIRTTEYDPELVSSMNHFQTPFLRV